MAEMSQICDNKIREELQYWMLIEYLIFSLRKFEYIFLNCVDII